MGSKTVTCVELLNMAILDIFKLQKTKPLPCNISLGGPISANGLVTEWLRVRVSRHVRMEDEGRHGQNVLGEMTKFDNIASCVSFCLILSSSLDFRFAAKEAKTSIALLFLVFLL